tara:strand:- start:3214 stop:3399 length:186 start_codon:yes stop_codon:yes gene_type:complete
MKHIIEKISNHCIEEVDEYIDQIIEMYMSVDNYKLDEYDGNELELKIKQQILFSLIKRVTK